MITVRSGWTGAIRRSLSLCAIGAIAAACGGEDAKPITCTAADSGVPAGDTNASPDGSPSTPRLDAATDGFDVATTPTPDAWIGPDAAAVDTLPPGPVYKEMRFTVPAFQAMPIAAAPTLDGVMSPGEWDNGALYQFAYNQIGGADVRAPVDQTDFYGTWKVVYQKNRLYGVVTREDDITITTSTNAYENDCIEIFINYQGKFLQMRSIVNTSAWDTTDYLTDAKIVWSADGKVAEFMLQFPEADSTGSFIGWNIAMADEDVVEDPRKYQMYPMYGQNRSWQGFDLSDLAFVATAPLGSVDGGQTQDGGGIASDDGGITQADGGLAQEDGGIAAPPSIEPYDATPRTPPTHFLPMPFNGARATQAPTLDGVLSDGEWANATVQTLAFNQLSQTAVRPPVDQSDLRGDWAVVYVDNVIYGYLKRSDNVTVTTDPSPLANDSVEIYVNYQGELAQLRTIVGSGFVASGFTGAKAVWSADGSVLEFKLTLPTDTLADKIVGWNIRLADSDQVGAPLKYALFPIPGVNDSWRGNGLGELKFEAAP